MIMDECHLTDKINVAIGKYTLPDFQISTDRKLYTELR
jgi:hypothetical protein